MGKLILYTALSLDGYLARKDGDISWLFSDQDYGYSSFIKSVETLIMGNSTYKLMLTFGEFPYKDKECFVFSRSHKEGKEGYVEFIKEDIPDFVRKLKEKAEKDIWLVGGGEINGLMLEQGLIDQMILSYHPVTLGNGIHIFNFREGFQEFTSQKAENFSSGLFQLTLNRK